MTVRPWAARARLISAPMPREPPATNAKRAILEPSLLLVLHRRRLAPGGRRYSPEFYCATLPPRFRQIAMVLRGRVPSGVPWRGRFQHGETTDEPAFPPDPALPPVPARDARTWPCLRADGRGAGRHDLEEAGGASCRHHRPARLQDRGRGEGRLRRRYRRLARPRQQGV